MRLCLPTLDDRGREGTLSSTIDTPPDAFTFQTLARSVTSIQGRVSARSAKKL